MQCFFRNRSVNFVSQPSRPCLVTLLQIKGINAAPSVLSLVLQMPARKKHTGVLPPRRFWKWIQPLLAWEITEGTWSLDIRALAITKPTSLTQWIKPEKSVQFWFLFCFVFLKKEENKYHYNFHLLWEAGGHLLRGKWTRERETMESLLKQHEGPISPWGKERRERRIKMKQIYLWSNAVHWLQMRMEKNNSSRSA